MLALVFDRASNMSSVLERMRENCSGVRSGLLLGCEGNIEMWRGFFCPDSCAVSFCELERQMDGNGAVYTFLPITPRQAIDGTAVMTGLLVLRWRWCVVCRALGYQLEPRYHQTRLEFPAY